MSRVTDERQAAFAVLRRTFEKDEFTEVAFRDEAERRGLESRSRAQAQRLAYGSVQRKGSSDALVHGFMKKGGRRPLPPVMAALRLGMYEILFADATPDHAAVDQAVSLVREAG